MNALRRAAYLMTAGLLACSFMTGPLAAQQTYKAPRTVYGHPDLQGSWTSATLTPLERPDKFGDRTTLTPAEKAELEGKNDALIALGNKPTDPNATVNDLPADCSGGRVTNCNYNAGWTDPGSTVMTVRGVPRSSFITNPTNGKIPFTAAGKKRWDDIRNSREGPGVNDNPETRSLPERCILAAGSSGGPVMLPGLYNNTYQIVQTADTVAILVEMMHDVRIVRLGGKHLPSHMRPWMGDSIGHYEGDTLVVETTNFPAQQNFRGSSENLKITERFTRSGPRGVVYQFTVEDPTTFSQPWGGEYEFKASNRVYEYACHEGNYGLEGILAGARAEEKETASR